MKLCVQNTRDDSIVGTFENPYRLKEWIKQRAKEQCQSHPENKVFKQSYAHLRWFLAKHNWFTDPQNLNVYLGVFKLPYHVSRYGG